MIASGLQFGDKDRTMINKLDAIEKLMRAINEALDPNTELGFSTRRNRFGFADKI